MRQMGCRGHDLCALELLTLNLEDGRQIKPRSVRIMVNFKQPYENDENVSGSI